MFENLGTFFKRIIKTEPKQLTSKDAAKERLHLVLMQDRANVSADFLELMKQEIIDVIKKYIDIDEKAMDVRLTNQSNEDGTNGAPALYANIPIINIKNEVKAETIKDKENAEEVNNENVVETTNAEPQEKNKEEVVEIEKVVDDVVKEETTQEIKEEIKSEEVLEEIVEENKQEEKDEKIENNEEKTLENEEEIDDVPTFDELLKQSKEDEKKEETTKEKKPKKNSKKK